MAEHRVLLVEDEVLVRELVAEVLSDAGYRVAQAGTGDEAAALIEAPGGFDLVLTDITTPGRLDGVAVADRARVLRPDVPVVFVSGRSDQQGRTRHLGQPCVFIPKPFRLSWVLAAVRRLVARG